MDNFSLTIGLRSLCRIQPGFEPDKYLGHAKLIDEMRMRVASILPEQAVSWLYSLTVMLYRNWNLAKNTKSSSEKNVYVRIYTPSLVNEICERIESFVGRQRKLSPDNSPDLISRKTLDSNDKSNVKFELDEDNKITDINETIIEINSNANDISQDVCFESAFLHKKCQHELTQIYDCLNLILGNNHPITKRIGNMLDYLGLDINVMSSN